MSQLRPATSQLRRPHLKSEDFFCVWLREAPSHLFYIMVRKRFTAIRTSLLTPVVVWAPMTARPKQKLIINRIVPRPRNRHLHSRTHTSHTLADDETRGEELEQRHSVAAVLDCIPKTKTFMRKSTKGQRKDAEANATERREQTDEWGNRGLSFAYSFAPTTGKCGRISEGLSRDVYRPGHHEIQDSNREKTNVSNGRRLNPIFMAKIQSVTT